MLKVWHKTVAMSIGIIDQDFPPLAPKGTPASSPCLQGQGYPQAEVSMRNFSLKKIVIPTSIPEKSNETELEDEVTGGCYQA